LRPRTRKIAVIGCSAVSLIAAISLFAIWHHLGWLHDTYVDRSIRAYVVTDDYQILNQAHSEYDWFGTARISQGEGEALLKNHPFHPGFSKGILAGKLDNPYVSDCPACWSYLEDGGDSTHHSYQYKLYILSPDKQQLMLYELFGS